MRLIARQVQGWANLAWVATVQPAGDEVQVFHGPLVEVCDDFVAEAVWPGPFRGGDFDRTELVAGSGVRLRDGQVTFVAPGSTLDRLAYCDYGGGWAVSNSLPALVALTGLKLEEGTDAYKVILHVIKDPERSEAVLPATPSNVKLLYHRDLVFRCRELRIEKKPDTVPSFADFGEYERHMYKTADAFGQNMRDAERRHPFSSLATLSRGYDSPVAAMMAQRVGCRIAVTLRRATSVWRRIDSGKPLAEAMGLDCREYTPAVADFREEEAVWSAIGRPGELNWTAFDVPPAPCVVFTGEHGDTAWSLRVGNPANPFARPGPGGQGLCEWRLWAGLVQCVVPFWCVARLNDLRRISQSDEMAPWRLGNDYDRPLARRMVEQAGVPRELFGMRKMNTALVSQFLWPYTRDAQESFARFLRERGIRPLGAGSAAMVRRVAHADMLVQRNLLSRIGLAERKRWWHYHPSRNLLFAWANEHMADRYRAALNEKNGEASAAGRARDSGGSVRGGMQR